MPVCRDRWGRAAAMVERPMGARAVCETALLFVLPRAWAPCLGCRAVDPRGDVRLSARLTRRRAQGKGRRRTLAIPRSEVVARRLCRRARATRTASNLRPDPEDPGCWAARGGGKDGGRAQPPRSKMRRQMSRCRRSVRGPRMADSRRASWGREWPAWPLHFHEARTNAPRLAAWDWPLWQRRSAARAALAVLHWLAEVGMVDAARRPP